MARPSPPRRAVAVGVGSLVALLALGWAAATDLQAHARDRSEYTALAAAHRTLAGARSDLAMKLGL